MMDVFNLSVVSGSFAEYADKLLLECYLGAQWGSYSD